MKLSVPSLVTNEKDFIDSVIAERANGCNKSYFNGISQHWKDRVVEYCTKSGNPELIEVSDTIETADKNKFINLYNSPQDTSVQKPLLETLRERRLQLCPCCGEDGTPNTLDHYLPKNTYPEFSILSKNLFPMCDICQGEKGTKDRNELNQRLFIHPYYDDFIEQQLLKLIIDPPYESPNDFTIKICPALATEDKELVERHIEEINLEKRFSKYFKDQYFRLLKLVNNIRNDGDDVYTMLKSFTLMACSQSVNSWEHLFYSSIIEDEDLLIFLIEGALPTCR